VAAKLAVRSALLRACAAPLRAGAVGGGGAGYGAGVHSGATGRAAEGGGDRGAAALRAHAAAQRARAGARRGGERAADGAARHLRAPAPRSLHVGRGRPRLPLWRVAWSACENEDMCARACGPI